MAAGLACCCSAPKGHHRRQPTGWHLQVRAMCAKTCPARSHTAGHPRLETGSLAQGPSPFGLDCRSASLSFVVWLHARCPPPKRQSNRHRGVCLTSDRPSHQVRTFPMLSRTKARASAPSQTLIRIWPHVLRRSKPPFFAGCPNWGTSLTWELGGDSRCRVPLTGQWGSPRQLVRIAVV